MTDLELGFLSVIGSFVSGLWSALSKITIFGMSFNMVLVSALAISTIMPFFLKFLSSGTGFVMSKERRMYEGYSRQVDAHHKKIARDRSKK